MAKSRQKDLEKVRRPRVHITTDVHTGDAEEKRELPFVVGVMGDFSGDPTEPLKPLKDRNFIQIDRDNFNAVMAKMTPGAELKVENTLKGDGSEFGVNLKFSSIEDFEPGQVVQQVEPLRKLLEIRNRLRDLQAKVDRSDDLEAVLERVLKSTEDMDALAKELGVEASAEDQPKEGE